jgi:lipoprotein Spr
MSNWRYSIFLLFFLHGATEVSFTPDGKEPAIQRKITADSVICFAEQWLGKPYRYACADPQYGFDCSGFTWYVYHHFGTLVPRSSIDYERFGKTITRDSTRPGDLIVFTGTNAAIRHAGHVGIIISGPGEGLKFIHCSSAKKGGGVVISSFSDSPYYEKRFIKIVRIPD